MGRRSLLAAAACLLLAAPAGTYPIDAYEDTGIARLEAYRLVQEGVMPGRLLPWGAQLYGEEIVLGLADHPDFVVPPPDPEFTAQVVAMLGDDAPHYGVTVLDITDPANPRFAAHNPDFVQNPGSVGKILVGLGWMQALADIHPDVEERKRVLRTAVHVADDFIIRDSHDVPFWTPGEFRYTKRPIEIGDSANLYTWLDWMLSSSSNAAAASLQAQLLLFREYGTAYPPSPEEQKRFFAETPKSRLGALYRQAMIDPLKRNGLDPQKLRQGSFFTRTGKSRVPGTTSVATAGELLSFFVLMEKGRLVDPWSSLELKKMLYITDSRVRYASARELLNFAVFYKSGSLYSCRAERGFECTKYRGNRLNYMNSVTEVEGVDELKGLRYITAVLSNVLKKNSADLHRDMGTSIQEMLAARYEVIEAERKAREAEARKRLLDELPWLEEKPDQLERLLDEAPPGLDEAPPGLDEDPPGLNEAPPGDGATTSRR